MSWSWGLDSFDNAGIRTNVPTDTRIQQTTANILNTFLVGSGVLHDLKVTAPATTTAGQPFTVTVTAEDAQGNPVTSYSGTIHFASTDTTAGVVLPPDSTLVDGQGAFSATLIRAPTQTLTVSDRANNLSSTVSLTVTAAPASTPLAASSLSLVVPASVVANKPFNATVTLKDRYGNVATGYRGTVYFATSDLVALELGKMPADYTFTAADGGIHTFSVTLMTPPSQTIRAADTANSSLSATSPPITVTAV